MMRTQQKRHNSVGPRFHERRYHPSPQTQEREPAKMAANLPYEFNKFSRYTRQLRHIMRETKQLFQEINKFGLVDSVQLLTADLPPSQVEEIEAVIERPPCIIVLGQTTYAKAFIINELFSQTILPVIDDSESAIPRWRQIHFKYGTKSNVSLCLPDSYELVENLAAYNQSWRTVPIEDIELKEYEQQHDKAISSASMEVSLNHALLKDGVSVIMTSQQGHDRADDVIETVKKCSQDVLPVFMFAINHERLTEDDLSNLKHLKEYAPNIAMFFIQVPPPPSHDLTESARHSNTNHHRSNTVYYLPGQAHSPPTGAHIKERRLSQSHTVLTFQQLCDIGYLSIVPKDSVIPRTKQFNEPIEVESKFLEKFENFSSVLLFVRNVLQANLIEACTLLNTIHTACLQNFILTAFDMTRDMLITPRRLEFAKEKESDLYLSLMDIAMKKQDEIKNLIMDTIESETPDLLNAAAEYEFTGADLPHDGVLIYAKDIKTCTGEIKELILNKLNTAIAGKLTGSVDVLRDSYTGTLTRCLTSLERIEADTESPTTTNALQQILNAAYQVEITVRTSSSLVKLLLEKMKQIVQSMPWSPPPQIDVEWKRSVAADMLSSLSESKLARSICVQIRDRLKNSHDAFLNALRQLEYRHSGRLERTEEQRLKVRKVHAPRVARMALESVSLRDMIMYGMPQLGREVGRGQYGVVYACDSWAGYSPCAIKSVVPPDEKHWNDLALEFYYTKNVPDHIRLVPIFGSVVDYTYGGGSSPAVLLIMPRLQRDLYTAIKTGLPWPDRLQVALDVVEGIRFLHSQGLVHRDIKLKNVLLDKNNRGAITDLGFCKPEAMMSGSIVGTPIHMSPELFTGKYDNSVDVYAFGILFWYICAGHVRLPYAFEQCTSKDMLWTSVKKGVRPEKLAHFEDDCWQLMQNCWEGEPRKRPLLGHVQPILQTILDRTEARNSPIYKRRTQTETT